MPGRNGIRSSVREDPLGSSPRSLTGGLWWCPRVAERCVGVADALTDMFHSHPPRIAERRLAFDAVRYIHSDA